VTATHVQEHAGQAAGADRDYYLMAEVAERLDIALNTAYAYAKRGELPFPVRRVGAQYRVPRQPFDRWLRGEVPESPAEPLGVRLTLEEAERLQVLLANAGGLLRRFEQASPWLPGGQHYADGLLAGAQDLQRRLLDARFAACPAEFPELAVQPLLPRPIPA
jgi:excisionase family DNA binding protein